jgi:hypothetical protein
MAETASPPESARRFAEFFALVIAQPALIEELAAAGDEASFVGRTVALGRVHQCEFQPAEVQAALNLARRSLLERRAG